MKQNFKSVPSVSYLSLLLLTYCNFDSPCQKSWCSPRYGEPTGSWGNSWEEQNQPKPFDSANVLKRGAFVATEDAETHDNDGRPPSPPALLDGACARNKLGLLDNRIRCWALFPSIICSLFRVKTPAATQSSFLPDILQGGISWDAVSISAASHIVAFSGWLVVVVLL